MTNHSKQLNKQTINNSCLHMCVIPATLCTDHIRTFWRCVACYTSDCCTFSLPVTTHFRRKLASTLTNNYTMRTYNTTTRKRPYRDGRADKLEVQMQIGHQLHAVQLLKLYLSFSYSCHFFPLPVLKKNY